MTIKNEGLRAYPKFSLCGLACGCCTLYLGGHCPGCGAPGRPRCKLLKCAAEQGGIEYCSQCEHYPCKRMAVTEDTVSFVTCRHRLKDLDQLKRTGPAAFEAQMEQKLAILAELLEDYNDGRRKSFYCLTVTLLPLAELETVMTGLRTLDPAMPVKEKAAAAVNQLQAAAQRHDILLKRNLKKPVQEKTNIEKEEGIIL